MYGQMRVKVNNRRFFRDLDNARCGEEIGRCLVVRVTERQERIVNWVNFLCCRYKVNASAWSSPLSKE